MASESKCPVSDASAPPGCPVSGQSASTGGCPVSGQSAPTGGCPVSGQAASGGTCPGSQSSAPSDPASEQPASADPSKPSVSSLPPEALALATRLFNMARQGDGTLLAYVEQGIPPNLTNHDGNTLLMLAAYAGHAELVSGLIRLGADVDAPNDRGQTPLAGAVFKLHDEVVRALLAGGADPEKGTPNAVDTARMFKRDEVLAMFEERKK